MFALFNKLLDLFPIPQKNIKKWKVSQDSHMQHVGNVLDKRWGCIMVTSHWERLETFESHLINCKHVCLPIDRHSAGLILLQPSWDTLRLPQLISLMVIGRWLETTIWDVWLTWGKHGTLWVNRSLNWKEMELLLMEYKVPFLENHREYYTNAPYSLLAWLWFN